MRNTTGTSGSLVRIRRSTSRPSKSGSIMSSTTASGRNSFAAATALLPVCAIDTCQPS